VGAPCGEVLPQDAHKLGALRFRSDLPLAPPLGPAARASCELSAASGELCACDAPLRIRRERKMPIPLERPHVRPCEACLPAVLGGADLHVDQGAVRCQVRGESRLQGVRVQHKGAPRPLPSPPLLVIPASRPAIRRTDAGVRRASYTVREHLRTPAQPPRVHSPQQDLASRRRAGPRAGRRAVHVHEEEVIPAVYGYTSCLSATRVCPRPSPSLGCPFLLSKGGEVWLRDPKGQSTFFCTLF